MFKIYKAGIENQQNRKIKTIRSDWGGEYYDRYDGSGRCSRLFANFLKDYGIVTQYTMLEIPRQNCIAKRQNRTLKDIIRIW